MADLNRSIDRVELTLLLAFDAWTFDIPDARAAREHLATQLRSIADRLVQTNGDCFAVKLASDETGEEVGYLGVRLRRGAEHG